MNTQPVYPAPALEAELLMESTGLAPAVRGATFYQGWSKLFQADAHYLDLSFLPAGSTGTLQGQVLGGETFSNRDVQGDVTLYRDDGSVAARSRLGTDGDFSLNVAETHAYRLAVTFAETSLRVSKLTLS